MRDTMMGSDNIAVTGDLPEPLTVTIQQTQRLTGESRSSIYNRIAAGEYDARKSGQRVLILYDSIKRRIQGLPRAKVKPGRVHKASPKRARQMPPSKR